MNNYKLYIRGNNINIYNETADVHAPELVLSLKEALKLRTDLDEAIKMLSMVQMKNALQDKMDTLWETGEAIITPHPLCEYLYGDDNYPYPERTAVHHVRADEGTGQLMRVCRPTKWGNPFTIGKDGTRQDVIIKFFISLIRNPKLISGITELSGGRLGCYCAPKDCHGDVLAAIADAYSMVESNPNGSDYELILPAPSVLHEHSPMLEWVKAEGRWAFGIGKIFFTGKDLYAVIRLTLAAYFKVLYQHANRSSEPLI